MADDEGLRAEQAAERSRSVIVHFWTVLNEGCAIEPALESIAQLVELHAGALQALVLASLFAVVTKPQALDECCKHIDEDIHPAFYECPILVPAHHKGSGFGVVDIGGGLVVSADSYAPPHRLDLRSLNALIGIDCDVGCLSMRNLRSWLSLMNAVMIESEGSELRLRFRYALLPPFCVFISQIPLAFPEFVSKIFDYVDNWAKRRTFDVAAIEILYSCARGKMSDTIPQCLRHVKAEVASSFVKLRGEIIGESQALQEEPGSSAVLPKFLIDLIDEWEANDPPESADGPSTASGVRAWYKENEETMEAFVTIREEIHEKFASLLAKHEHTYSHEELERTKPQTMVLLKRELVLRAKIIYHLTKLVTALDLRHAQLAEALHHFARLLQTLSA